MASADLYARIQERLADLKLSPRAASLMAGKGADVIRNLQRAVQGGREFEFRTGTLELLAQVLQTTPEWLLSGDGPSLAPFSQAFLAKDNGDMPIYGTVDVDGNVFEISDYVVRRIPRPYMLIDMPTSYGLIIENTSMAPAYEPGDAILIGKHIGKRPWRDMLIDLPRQSMTRIGMIRRFQMREDGTYLQRFNPPSVERAPPGASFSVIVAKVHSFL